MPLSKTLAVILAVVVIVAVLAAGAAYYLSQQGKPPETITVTQPGEIIYLRFAGWSAGPTEMENYNKIIAEFEKNNPNIKVKYEVITQMFHENILASYAAGAAPDVFYVDSAWAPIFIEKGALYPIGDKLPREFIDQFYPFLLEPFKDPSGKVYGLPKDWSMLLLFYNKKLFAQAGVPEPSETWTWDDLFDAAKKIYEKTGVPGLVVHPELNRWLPYLISNGASPPKFTSAADVSYFDNPGVKNAFTSLLTRLVEARKAGYYVIPSDVNAGWSGEAFGKQLAAMTIEGSWMIPFLADQFKDFKYDSDWGIAMLPKGPNGRVTVAYTVALGVNSATKNLDAALKFIQYIEGVEGQKLLVVKMGHTLPSIKQLANDPELWPQHRKSLSFIDKYTQVTLFFYGPKTGPIEGEIAKVIQGVLAGSISVDSALQEMKNAVKGVFG